MRARIITLSVLKGLAHKFCVDESEKWARCRGPSGDEFSYSYSLNHGTQICLNKSIFMSVLRNGGEKKIFVSFFLSFN